MLVNPVLRRDFQPELFDMITPMTTDQPYVSDLVDIRVICAKIEIIYWIVISLHIR